MDIPSGQQHLSEGMTESQELQTIAEALLGNQNMDNILPTAPDVGEPANREGHDELSQFLPRQGSLAAMAPQTGTRCIDDAGMWVQASGSSMGPSTWGLHPNEQQTCAVGMEPVPVLQQSPHREASGDGGSKPDWMLKKRQDMLEKNRRNQKKFRERQKAKMVGLEHQVNSLSAQVEKLRFQNTSLASQNDLLSKVLVMKEGQVKVLRHESKAKDKKGTADEDPCPPCSMRGVLGAKGATECASKYTPEVVMNMTLDDICEKYKDYVHKLSALVLVADAPGGSKEAEEEINQNMLEVSELLSKVVVLKPDHGAMFVGRNFEFGRRELPTAAEAEKCMAGVLRSLELTDDQQKRIVALYRQLQSHLQRIKEKRNHLNNVLQSQLAVAGENYIPGIGMHRTAQATVQMDEVTQELKDTVEFERHEYANLVSAFFGLVLTPLQSARTIVHSYPYYPDVMGLAMLVMNSVKEEVECSESDFTGAGSTQG